MPMRLETGMGNRAAVRRNDFVPSDSSVICSSHLTLRPEDFDRTGQTVRLRDGVTPSVLHFSCMENQTETVTFIRRSLALDPAEYKMDDKRRGLALIINQEHFLSRRGTEADRDNLEKRLIKLKFEVRAYDDLEKKDVEDRITEGSVAKDSKTATDRAALDPAEEYKMDNKRRGLALIFNQEHFEDDFLTTRSGTKADRDKLEKRLMELNFEVRAYDDLKKKDVEDRIKEAAEADHSDADCFLLVFLSHGEKDYVSTYDDKISIEDITSPFKGDKCRSLVGKPKIFIFQACRGNKPDDPVTACDAVDSVLETNEEVMESSGVYTLPAGADFIMCYSVAEGYCSFRDPVNGSWYIQDLCELLQEYGDSLEFAELLTLVNRKVSMRSVKKSSDKNVIGKKQIPCFASMLTKKLYFRPKK